MATVAWSSGFEIEVDNLDLGSDLDSFINNRVLAVRERANVEHDWSDASVSAGYTETGRHSPGSARAFFQIAAPTTILKPDGSAAVDASGDGTLDQGRLWVDSDDGNSLKVYDAAWEDVRSNSLTLDSPSAGDLAQFDGTNWLTVSGDFDVATNTSVGVSVRSTVGSASDFDIALAGGSGPGGVPQVVTPNTPGINYMTIASAYIGGFDNSAGTNRTVAVWLVEDDGVSPQIVARAVNDVDNAGEHPISFTLFAARTMANNTTIDYYLRASASDTGVTFNESVSGLPAGGNPGVPEVRVTLTLMPFGP